MLMGVLVLFFVILILSRYLYLLWKMPGPTTFQDTITSLHESYRHNPTLNDALRRTPPLLSLSPDNYIRRSGDQCHVLSHDPFNARIVLAIFYQEPSVNYVIWLSPDHAKSISPSFVSDSRDTFVTLLFEPVQQCYSEHIVMFQRSRVSMDILYYLCEHPGIHRLFHDKLGVVVDLESDTDVEYSYLFTIYRKNNLSISPTSPSYFLKNRIVENSSKPILFQTWVSHTTQNDHIWRCYHKILNMYPDHSYLLFSDFEMKAFIRQHYDERVCAQYDNIVPTAFKSDFFRYLFLYRYGGMYLDISVEPVLPLFDFLANFYPSSRYEFVSARDNGLKNGIWNGFMYCEPQHPIMKLCIEKILQRGGKNDGACLDYTGPSLLGSVVSSCCGSSSHVLLLEFKDSMYIRDPLTKQNLFAPKNKSKKAITLTRNMYKESKKKHYSAHCLYEQVFLFP